MTQEADTVVCAGCVMKLGTDARYTEYLTAVQASPYYSNVVGDATARTITFDVIAPV